ADDDTARRAAATLREWTRDAGDDTSGDDAVLRVRAPRGFLALSATAARTALGGIDAHWLLGELAKRRFPQAEVHGALADVARIERAGAGAGSGDRAMARCEGQH